MRTKMLTVFVLLISILVLLPAAPVRAGDDQTTSGVNTAYDDSLSRLNASVGDVFVVDVDDFVVYPDKHEIETQNFLDWKGNTLTKGEKFKVVEIVRLKVKLGARVQLADGSFAYVVNLTALPKYCFKEGSSPMKSRMMRFFASVTRFTHRTFWITLGITLAVSLLFLVFFGKIDKLFYHWGGTIPKIGSAGLAFLIASAVFGALAGASELFYDTVLRNFAANIPVISLPEQASFILKFYWSLQLFFLAFWGWAIFRSIREFGSKAGVVRSLMLLIPAMAIFWTAFATSFLMIVAILLLAFTGMMGKDLERGPQASTMIKEETQTFTGENRTVQVNYDAQGRQKSKKYL